MKPHCTLARRAQLMLLRLAMSVAVTSAAWLALTWHPQPLFGYELQRGNIVVHAREPLPEAARTIVDDALQRIARSSLYDPAQRYHVFLTGKTGLYGLLTGNARGSGLTNCWGNVFIRRADVAGNRVFAADGREKDGGRTLTYHLAHELTHAMALRRLGWIHVHALAAFQKEGYADHIGFAHDIDLAAERAALVRGDPRMNVASSGLYARYELLVVYLMKCRKMTAEQLLAEPLRQARIEADLRSSELQ
jgi:hypothetical protein